MINIDFYLTNLFLSGFIFMCVYKKLRNIQLDLSIMLLWSLFISYIIRNFYGAIHGFVLVDYNFNEYIKVITYILTGAFLPFVIILIYRSEIFRKFLLKINYQTINSDIFDDVIDYKDKTIMTIYLKDSDFYYIGTFSLREEKGRDSYIALIDCIFMNKETNESSNQPNLPSSVLINLNDVERIEIIYSDESEVWKRLQTGNYN